MLSELPLPQTRLPPQDLPHPGIEARHPFIVDAAFSCPGHAADGPAFFARCGKAVHKRVPPMLLHESAAFHTKDRWQHNLISREDQNVIDAKITTTGQGRRIGLHRPCLRTGLAALRHPALQAWFCLMRTGAKRDEPLPG